jgi:hypothetical protein
MRRVQFYVLPRSHGWPDGDDFVWGAWLRSGNRIVVGEYVSEHPAIVRHEMLHAILQRGDHPREYFVSRCGSVVDSPDLHYTLAFAPAPPNERRSRRPRPSRPVDEMKVESPAPELGRYCSRTLKAVRLNKDGRPLVLVNP